jgi:hypothetical protein
MHETVEQRYLHNVEVHDCIYRVNISTVVHGTHGSQYRQKLAGFCKNNKTDGVDFTSLLKIDWSNLKFLKN